jgi:hypothetical protein
VDLYDEEGNRNPLLDSPFLVPSNEKALWRPKWDFEKGEWTEGDIDTAIQMTKLEKKQQFKTECNRLIEEGFSYNEDHFNFRKGDGRDNLESQLIYLLAFPDDDNIAWKTENNGVKIFSRDEFFNICKAGKEHYRENTGALWELEAYIDALTSLEELNSLTDFESAKILVS